MELLETLIGKLLKRLLHAEFLRFHKLLDNSLYKNNELLKKLDHVQQSIDTYITILKRYERKQKILEKKIELIEDYFDPNPKN